MKKKQIILIFPLLVMGVFLIFASSCKKDKEDDPTPPATFSCGDNFTDSRDGTVYPTIKIGSQCWLKKNLAYLPSVVGPDVGSLTTPNYYVYGYDGANVTTAKASSNYSTYGVLYNWAAVMAGSTSSSTNPSGVQGICPTGWHLPSDAEWTQLSDYLGGENVAGGKLKATGTIEAGTGLWHDPNTGATNESGFTSLPGGFRRDDGSFINIDYYSYWWSTTMETTTFAWCCILFSNNGKVNQTKNPKTHGYSVRCIKD